MGDVVLAIKYSRLLIYFTEYTGSKLQGTEPITRLMGIFVTA